MAKPPPKCKGCDMVLKWPPWTGKPSRPTELDGKAHNCPKFSGGGEDYPTKSKYDTTYAPTETFYFCGKCNTLCGNTPVFPWCETCKMYPNHTNSGLTETDNGNFKPNPEVKSLIASNDDEVHGEFRVKNIDSSPVNAVHMNNDGTIKNGYKLTPELTKWFNEGGKEIIIEMNSKIWYKNKERITT